MPVAQSKEKAVQPNSCAALQDKRRVQRLHRIKQLVRLYKFVNGPLFVAIFSGLLIFWISNHIQERFTSDQQKLQIAQTKRTNRLNAAIAAQDEIIRALNKRAVGIAVLITPYRRNFNPRQYREYVQYATAAAHEWDNNKDLMSLKTKTYFDDDPKIQEDWKHMVDELDQFNDQVSNLNDSFKGITTPSDRLTKAVHSCDEKLEQLDAELESLARELNNFIKQEETKPLT
jgi:methyl-accepting chemotaxis protein